MNDGRKDERWKIERMDRCKKEKKDEWMMNVRKEDGMDDDVRTEAPVPSCRRSQR